MVGDDRVELAAVVVEEAFVVAPRLHFDLVGHADLGLSLAVSIARH